jgi:hypothetical protein
MLRGNLNVLPTKKAEFTSTPTENEVSDVLIFFG